MYISKKQIELSYGDTDMMGVIYHANYLKYFEHGRIKFIEDLGFRYMDLEETGYVVPVAEVQISYKKAVRYGDTIFVKTWIEENTPVKTIYGYHIVNDDETILYVTGKTTHVIVQKDTFKPVIFKRIAPKWFAKYEEIKKKKEE
jgi:acyl-CoA thioester hydrolase